MAKLTNRARELRKDQTKEEAILWKHLRSRRFKGIKFRRQVPIDRFVVDFLCKKHRLIIELDGSQHAENREYDELRTSILEAKGYRVIRYWNNQVLTELEGVLESIELVIADGK